MPLLSLVLVLAALPENTVIVVPYQGGGRAAELTATTLKTMANEVEARGFATSTPADQQRSAAMCGEDAQCLATIGRVAKVGWVLAIGLGSAGKTTFFTAVLVDVTSGKIHRRHEARAERTFDAASMSATAVGVLFEGVTLVSDAPIITPPAPPPPEEKQLVLISTAPAEPKFRGAAIATGIGTGVAAIGGAIFTIVAQQHFTQLPTFTAAQRPAEDASQRGLNLGADLAFGVAIAAAAVTVLFLLLDLGGGAP